MTDDISDITTNLSCSDAPFITFRREPTVALTATNNQPNSGLFSTTVDILDGDTTERVARRLARTERMVKDPKKVKLYR